MGGKIRKSGRCRKPAVLLMSLALIAGMLWPGTARASEPGGLHESQGKSESGTAEAAEAVYATYEMEVEAPREGEYEITVEYIQPSDNARDI